jgi:hypothetical protein
MEESFLKAFPFEIPEPSFAGNILSISAE